jgi:uncharacterized protein YgiM (DUF1202 family)
MQKILLILLLLPFTAWAQPAPQTVYVAHKAGLSIREKPDVKAKVLDKIPYGTKITIPYSEADTVSIITDGMTGYFRKVTYNGKTGYIIDCYLFETVPPKTTVKTLKEYLAQLSPKFGAELVVKSGTMGNLAENGYEQKKQLYKNGAEYHWFMAYEYNSETCIIPNLRVQQAYLLLRLMPEFKEVAGEKDEVPSENKNYTKGGIEYTVTVDKAPGVKLTSYGVRKIRIEYADGAYSFIEIYQMENEVVIHWGSGV